MSVDLVQLADANAVAIEAAALLHATAASLSKTQPEVHIAVTGGTVGILMLAKAAELDWADIDTNKLHFWWGDERFVEAQSKDRNFLQAITAWPALADMPNLHPFPSADEGLTLDDAAEQFAEVVEQSLPKFDLVFLGVGPDGHVASLFPGKSTLKSLDRVLAEHDSPKPPPARLTFSLLELNRADRVCFVVAGVDKADAVSVAWSDDSSSLPVGLVAGVENTLWLTDSSATSKLY